ncbi:hypothetical protein SARC_14940 [Sphaeroforma arctica JP610]|uniref:SH2 domain-containing protein n=1 Tax=Sphaeroforma arctica JP610 TaxID=667725 RepID=A0A0L0F8Q5_9EUKA|nr:hypothetical protein SARC_14940 [Sphaeroforma arctica JP610]KNC72503.1 hypothetical protein SARC_14940 [Sphaeroforma arctica JP610]|eukprot:XP_014146405.1 hypothetical protein SARC_14940 [Sphaeroforma arctica JP610]
MLKKLQLLDLYLENKQDGDFLVAALSYTPEAEQAQYLLGLKHSNQNVYIRIHRKKDRYNIDGDTGHFDGAQALLAHFEGSDVLQDEGRPSRLVRPISCFEADSAGYILL